ncbi:RDD family protein [Moraxella marmotae]|uniref:RDD family protein n=1 Tax=Moraxella marmotae TaxID=3344520 RepID=UPI0035F2EEA9
MKIYLARNRVQAGPYTLSELNTMLASGEVQLDDLAWHAPMSQWQRLGDLTDNQHHYQPKQGEQGEPNQQNQADKISLADATQDTNPYANSEPRGFGDNVDLLPNHQAGQDKPKRVSVDELYGRPSNAAQKPKVNVVIVKPNTAKASTLDQTAYASIGSRFLAVVINFLLFVLTLLPFLQQFLTLNPDPKLLGAGDFAARMAYAQELAAQMPTHAINLSSLLLLGYLAVQLILIVARAQSFGKMVVGIRTVDAVTFAKPSFFKRVVLRVIVLFLIYQLIGSLPIPVNMALILLSINYLIAAKSPNKQGWHDKLAGTVVVKTSAIGFDDKKAKQGK